MQPIEFYTVKNVYSNPYVPTREKVLVQTTGKYYHNWIITNAGKFYDVIDPAAGQLVLSFRTLRQAEEFCFKLPCGDLPKILLAPLSSKNEPIAYGTTDETWPTVFRVLKTMDVDIEDLSKINGRTLNYDIWDKA